jgi:hypothetical protein
LQNQIDGYDQGESTRTRPEEPRDVSQVETPEEGEKEEAAAAAAQQGVEGVWKELGRVQEQQQEEDVVRVVERIEMQGEQRQQEVEDELAMEELQEEGKEEDADNPKDEDYSLDIGDEGDEDDKDLRLAKRRNLPSISTDEVLKGSYQHSAKLSLRLLRRSISPSSMLVEIDNVQSQTMHGYLPTSVVDEQRYTPQPSRSPSATAESVPAAEY